MDGLVYKMLVLGLKMVFPVYVVFNARARHNNCYHTLHNALPALTSYYSKQTNYMGIFTVSGCMCVWCVRAQQTLTLTPSSRNKVVVGELVSN